MTDTKGCRRVTISNSDPSGAITALAAAQRVIDGLKGKTVNIDISWDYAKWGDPTSERIQQVKSERIQQVKRHLAYGEPLSRLSLTDQPPHL